MVIGGLGEPGVRCIHAETRHRRGTRGVGHGQSDGRPDRGRSDRGISDEGHEPSNQGTVFGLEPEAASRRDSFVSAPPTIASRGVRGAVVHVQRADSAHRRRPRSSGDPAEIQVRPQRAGRSDQFRIMGDCPREPVDVARLERRDLAERVSVELPELDDVRGRVLQGRERGGPEARISPSVKRTGGCRGTPGFTVEPLGPKGLLAARRSGRAGSGVTGPEGFRRIEAAGDRAGGSRRGRSARASSRGPARIGPRAPGRAGLELLVGPVDLGHLPGCGPGSGRIGARHVRMVHPGQLPPGGLDRGLRSPRRDTQDDMWIFLRHGPSVSTAGA